MGFEPTISCLTYVLHVHFFFILQDEVPSSTGSRPTTTTPSSILDTLDTDDLYTRFKVRGEFRVTGFAGFLSANRQVGKNTCASPIPFCTTLPRAPSIHARMSDLNLADFWLRNGL